MEAQISAEGDTTDEESSEYSGLEDEEDDDVDELSFEDSEDDDENDDDENEEEDGEDDSSEDEDDDSAEDVGVEGTLPTTSSDAVAISSASPAETSNGLQPPVEDEYAQDSSDEEVY